MSSSWTYEAPDRRIDSIYHFPGKIDRPDESRQGDLAFMVMIAETDTQLIGQGTLLDPADQQISVELQQKPAELQRV